MCTVDPKTSSRLQCFSALLFSLCLTIAAHGQDDEVLLTITGDRIDLLVEGEASGNAEELVMRYYELLPADSQDQLLTLRRRMDRRMEDYEVAFAAGDTAEINEIVLDISAYWVRVQQIHFEQFTAAAMAQLADAYAEIFPLITI